MPLDWRNFGELALGGTVCHCGPEVIALGSVQRKEWKLDCHSPPISKQAHHLEPTASEVSIHITKCVQYCGF